jgi:large subunit ribosomal protein L11
VNSDRSYELTLHNPPSTFYLKQAAGIQRGSMTQGEVANDNRVIIHMSKLSCMLNFMYVCGVFPSTGSEVAGKITLKHIYEIAKIKQEDPPMRFRSLEEICLGLIGTARSCGIEVIILQGGRDL